MKSQILIEHLMPSESNLIVESTKTDKSLWLSGIFMESDLQNRNGRTYPKHEIERAVLDANKRIAESNGIFGELDHPQGLTVNLDRISHVITEMKMVGNNAIGKAKIIEKTPMGSIAKALIESGTKLGVSSRGAGQVSESVVSDFAFVTVDIVCQPSAPNAMPNSIYESLDSSSYGKEIITLSEEIQHDSSAQKFLKAEILKFLSEMNWKK
jgi:hypothetical protein